MAHACRRDAALRRRCKNPRNLPHLLWFAWQRVVLPERLYREMELWAPFLVYSSTGRSLTGAKKGWCSGSKIRFPKNQIDTRVSPFRSLWKTGLTVILFELCEARKKLEKIKQKGDLHFFPLAMALPVLGLIKKVSLNGCFWINFVCWERRLSWFFSVVMHDCDNAEENMQKTTYFLWHYLNGAPTQKKGIPSFSE